MKLGKPVGKGAQSVRFDSWRLHLQLRSLSPRRLRVIDFDDCAWAYYSHDIATLRGRMEWRDDYADLRTALILGYPEERTFPQEHEALLAHSLKRNRRPSRSKTSHAVR